MPFDIVLDIEDLDDEVISKSSSSTSRTSSISTDIINVEDEDKVLAYVSEVHEVLFADNVLEDNIIEKEVLEVLDFEDTRSLSSRKLPLRSSSSYRMASSLDIEDLKDVVIEVIEVLFFEFHVTRDPFVVLAVMSSRSSSSTSRNIVHTSWA